MLAFCRLTEAIAAMLGTTPTVLGTGRAGLLLIAPTHAVAAVRRTGPTIRRTCATALVRSTVSISTPRRAGSAIRRAGGTVLVGRYAEPISAVHRAITAILGTRKAGFLVLSADPVSTVRRTGPAIRRTCRTILGSLADIVSTKSAGSVRTNAGIRTRAGIFGCHLGTRRPHNARRHHHRQP